MATAAVKFGGSEVVEFELGEDVRDERRLRQDEEWVDAVSDGRAHVSHREMAMLNAPQLSLAISDYQLIEEFVSALNNPRSILSKISHEALRLIVEYAFPGHGTLVTTSVIRRELEPLMESERASSNAEGNEFPFRICLRKRPMMNYEVAFGAYDVCTVDTRNGLTLHEGRLARNGRQLSMTHHQFVVDRVFDESATNEAVCLDAVEPLVSWAEAGHTSTLLCFGQTGTGKTYTLYGALEYISARLVGHSIRITFYEVHGKKCYDLLRGRNIVHLRSDAHDAMHVRGAHTVEIAPLSRPQELIEVLREALSLRSSKVTERNPISSRSHAVCTIELLRAAPTSTGATGSTARPVDRSLGAHLAAMRVTGDASASTPVSTATKTATYAVAGKITLVDLAGSERNYETTQMTAAQHKESADINFALMVLKDCFRAYHAQLTAHRQSLDERLQRKLADSHHTATGAAAGPTERNPASVGGENTVPNIFTCTTQTSGSLKAGGISGVKGASPTTTVDGNGVSTGHTDEVTASNGTASAGAPARIPFRASTLTKVLKECFTSGPRHRTTIMATISPTPTDLQHSLNTLNHVVLMCPELQQLTHRLTIEVPLNMYLQLQNRFNAKLAHSTDVGSGLSTKQVPDWTAEEVIAWLATAERGRFKHVVLPTGIDGQGLLLLSEKNMVDLFAAGVQKVARVEKEGAAWVETAEETNRSSNLGRALWRALRREMQSTLARESQLQQAAQRK